MTTTTRAALLGGSIGGLSGGVVGLSLIFLVRQPDLKWLGPFVAAFLASLLSAVIAHHLYKQRTTDLQDLGSQTDEQRRQSKDPPLRSSFSAFLFPALLGIFQPNAAAGIYEMASMLGNLPTKTQNDNVPHRAL